MDTINTNGIDKNLHDSPFRPGSSNVDWCEPNYIVSAYISEFWNTVRSSCLTSHEFVDVHICLYEIFSSTHFFLLVSE